MSTSAIITSMLTLFAGTGIFLIACTMMSTEIETLGGRKLKRLFGKVTDSKLAGVGTGAVVSAVIQSSSATSVMVIGFVNAGAMTLTQAAAVIFGANVGTTVTGQLVALGLFGGNGVSSSAVFSAFAGIGAFILAFAKKKKTKQIGGVIAGFGMLFAGLSMMSGAMGEFAELDSVRNFLAEFKNPVLLVLIGAVLTAVVQSSSVMTSMAITMSVSGLITVNQGIYITMGANIGTCATALIAGLTGSKNAKRAALIHFFFNVGGVLLFLIIALFLKWGGTDYGAIFSNVFPNAPHMQLAVFHTVFNIVTVIFILPFTNKLVNFVCKLIPDRKTAKNTNSKPNKI